MTDKRSDAEKAALGRMCYGLRALTSGYRMVAESPDLLGEAVASELIFHVLNMSEGRLADAEKMVGDLMGKAWDRWLEENESLRSQRDQQEN